MPKPKKKKSVRKASPAKVLPPEIEKELGDDEGELFQEYVEALHKMSKTRVDKKRGELPSHSMDVIPEPIEEEEPSPPIISPSQFKRPKKYTSIAE